MKQAIPDKIINAAVIVAALGYFVDIYDLLLFSIVRVESLKAIGLDAAGIKTQGEYIISMQMLGLTIGGILWGVLGDKKGRLSVLFGSILLYSIANIINGFVETPQQYAWIRLIAGIGLAGELGAGITLVSELAGKEKRGLSTSLVAGIGLTGAVAAYFISKIFDWRTCYFIGGALGFALLFLRISVAESGMFHSAKKSTVQRGNFLMFFTNKERFKRYAMAVLIGLPTWYVIGILVTFSNNFAQEKGITEEVQPGKATMYAYAAIAIADVLIGIVSYYLKSRKKALYLFFALAALSIGLYFSPVVNTATRMYAVCALLGFSTGFWAIFVTMAAEQFGTNLRATAATTIPNIVRGSLPLLLLLFNALQGSMSYLNAGLLIGVLVLLLSTMAVYFSKETYHNDLDFVEQDGHYI